MRVALAERAKGIEPTGRVILPGVLPWNDYVKRRLTWDKIRQTIGLDAYFYEGAEVLMFPPDWLNLSERRAAELRASGRPRKAEGIGIDPGEGVANTAMCAIDRYGIIELVSKKTPDTTEIVSDAINFIRKHGVPPERVAFDRGGGGKQHADRIRKDYRLNVRTVAFGESLSLDLRRGLTPFPERFDIREERYVYVNRRAEMYGTLREWLDPSRETMENPLPVFAIPSEYTLLRSELAPIPLLFDQEGRLRMLPKNKKDPDSEEKSLTELIGHSPDEADALVLALHAMTYRSTKVVAGGVASPIIDRR